MYIRDACAKIKNILTSDFIEDAGREAAIIVREASGLDERVFLSEMNGIFLKPGALKKAEHMARQRLKGRSLASVTGKKDFYDCSFAVDDNVLIPRPETELIIDILKDNRSREDRLEMLDIGAGSGNISIALAKHFCGSVIDAVEISRKAVRIIKKNIVINNVSPGRITILNKNIFKYIPDKKYDIIVSNPPYIKTGELEALLKNKTVADPPAALDGGADGLEFYRRIKDISDACLKSGGMTVLEHGMGQKEDILKIFSCGKYRPLCFKDLAGIDRAILFKKGDGSI